MPKKLRLNPNQRVDLEDFNRSSYEYSQESASFNREKLVQSFRSLVSHGFRVEIPDQSVDAGAFTVYNGLGIDRNGDLVNNEQQVNDARTARLLGTSSTFFVEVELVEASSDVDSRAFWDPTDQSFVPPGSEFSFNVATRTTPDWQIVTPVNSSSFDLEGNPASTRIPIAILETDPSNEIINVTTVTAKTIVAEDHAAGATKIIVLDSTLFPDSGIITVGSESGKTLSFNDRANNTLTIDALSGPQNAGVIVQQTGVAATFLLETTEAAPSIDSTVPVVGDVRRRLFAGDETKGSALSMSKETAGARDDLDIRSQKDHADFLAAQQREMKFGSLRPGVTNSAPPSDFSSTRHYDYAGSITGARAHTITIGDGLNSYGDFNNDKVNLAIADALAALPATGGSIYVKKGEYTWSTTLSFIGKAELIFDLGATFVAGTYSGGMLSYSGDEEQRIVGFPECTFHDIYVWVVDGSGNTVVIEDSTIGGLRFGAFATDVTFKAHKTTFTSIDVTHPVIENQQNSIAQFNTVQFTDCDIVYAGASAAGINLNLLVEGLLGHFEFRGCTFQLAMDTGSAAGFVLSSNSATDIIFKDCSFLGYGSSSASYGIRIEGSTVDGLSISGCNFDFLWDTGLGVPPKVVSVEPAGSLNGVSIVNCDFTKMLNWPGTTSGLLGSSIYIEPASGTCGINSIVGNKFGGPGGGASPSGFAQQVYVAPGAADYLSVDIRDNEFSQFNKAICLEGDVSSVISSNSFKYTDDGVTDYDENITGIDIPDNTSGEVSITGNTMNIHARCSDNSKSVFGINSDDSSCNLVVSSNIIDLTGYTRASIFGVRVFCDTRASNVNIIGNTIKTTGNASMRGISSYTDTLSDANVSITGNNVTVIPTNNVVVENHGIWYECSDDVGEKGNHSLISNNTVSIKSPLVSSSVRVRGVYVSGQQVVTSYNVVHVWYGLTLSAGIYLTGHNLSAIGNHVTLYHDSSQVPASGNACYGIQYSGTAPFPGWQGPNISNNTVIGGKNTKWGILVENNAANLLYSVNVSGNTVYCKSEVPTLTSGCIRLSNNNISRITNASVSNNTCREEYTAEYDIRQLISVRETGGGSFPGVSISSNNLYGGIIGASAARASQSVNSAIDVDSCEDVHITGNLILDWSTLTYYGCSIHVGGGDRCNIMQNSCSPSNGAIRPAIDLDCPDGIMTNNTAWGSTGTPFSTSSGAARHYVATSSGGSPTQDTNEIT